MTSRYTTKYTPQHPHLSVTENNSKNLIYCSRKNFVCLARELFWPLVSSYNFTQWVRQIPFGPDDFPGHIEFVESPPDYLFLSNLQTERTYFCQLLYQQQLTTMRIEPSSSSTVRVNTSRPRGSHLKMNLTY